MNYPQFLIFLFSKDFLLKFSKNIKHNPQNFCFVLVSNTKKKRLNENFTTLTSSQTAWQELKSSMGGFLRFKLFCFRFDANSPFTALSQGITTKIPRRPSSDRTLKNKNLANLYAGMRKWTKFAQKDINFQHFWLHCLTLAL